MPQTLSMYCHSSLHFNIFNKVFNTPHCLLALATARTMGCHHSVPSSCAVIIIISILVITIILTLIFIQYSSAINIQSITTSPLIQKFRHSIFKYSKQLWAPSLRCAGCCLLLLEADHHGATVKTQPLEYAFQCSTQLQHLGVDEHSQGLEA